MNNLIYLVIGLAIVLILAFVLLRSKKTTPPPRQPAPVAPPRPTHDRASQAAPVAAAASTYQDRLDAAQRFIDQQRYDEAIGELKQGLVSHPHNKDITLKLLNIYAMTNRSEPFSDLYQSIQMQGDAHTLAAADSIKSLLDAEQASSRQVVQTAPAAAAVVTETPAQSFAPSSSDDDLSLDFDFSQDTASTPAEPEEEHLSFDDLESQFLTDDAPVSEQESVSQETATDVNATSDLATDTDAGLEFTLNDSHNEGLTLETAPVEDTQPETDDSAFTLDVEESQAAETPATTATADDAFNVDNDFNLTNDTADSTTLNDSADESADFLELEDLIAEDTGTDTLNTELADAAAATQTVELDATDMEHNELSFADIESNELGIDDDFSFATESATTPPVVLETEEATDFNADSLAIESPAVESAPAAHEEDFTGSDFAEEAPSTDMPVSTPDESQFAADFDYVNELDSVQVTIDLAAQYLELGEYESAKRLLNEVSKQGTTEQQSQVESLLAKAV